MTALGVILVLLVVVAVVATPILMNLYGEHRAKAQRDSAQHWEGILVRGKVMVFEAEENLMRITKGPDGKKSDGTIRTDGFAGKRS